MTPEQMSELNPNPIECATFNAGTLVRHRMRAVLVAAGLEWTEHKGWFESSFAVRGTSSQILKVSRWVTEEMSR